MSGFVRVYVEHIEKSIPIGLLCRSGLGGFLWYIALKVNMRDLRGHNIIKLSNKVLSKKLGVSEVTVIHWKNELEARNIIKQTESDKTLYHINEALITKGKIQNH